MATLTQHKGKFTVVLTATESSGSSFSQPKPRKSLVSWLRSMFQRSSKSGKKS